MVTTVMTDNDPLNWMQLGWKRQLETLGRYSNPVSAAGNPAFIDSIW